jgi:hypothetical protein
VVVEHVFVSVLPVEEVLLRADEMLSSLGFIGPLDPAHFDATQPAAQRPASTTTVRDWKRGCDKLKKAKSISDLPQRARLEFDRGRVALALSVETPPRSDKLHAEMLLSIARSLELRLSKDASVTDSLAPADAVQAEIDRKTRRARIARIIVLSILVLFILGVVALVIVATRYP